MKVELIVIGKTDKDFVKEGIQVFKKKIGHYLPFTIKELPAGNHSNREKALKEEGLRILKLIQPRDELILLDHGGKTYSSENFAKFMEKKMSNVNGTLYFAIGGPFGFSKDVYDRAKGKLSLSPMIFSHQIIRLIFLEQLYRSMTIIRNEPYHHS
ncbi:MAG: 23S rRNA (pseudouridine(1915)-N(3))-methyltransferase RlmH [Bacteroidia bacterium]|nr:23S rRNA (pseudouridine(1915)-N(3))-methyltransferase RlmH [Bacteroidia bacterium]